MEKEIIDEYINDEVSVESLSLKYHIGKIKIKDILLKNNVPLRKRGGQTKVREIKPFDIDLTNKQIVCNKCGKEFFDVENKSGGITSHIHECYPEIEIPSKFLRNEYKKEHGTLWHFQFFKLIDKVNIEKLNCPMCVWSTTDLTNKSGSFTKHIINEHNGIKDFLSSYPEYEYLFQTYNKDQEKEELLLDENNFTTCKICGEKMKVISNTHLKNYHNITSQEYKLMFPNENLASRNSRQIFKENTIISNINSTPTWTSSGEIEISNFIRGLGIDVEKAKNRKLLNGKEIDIIIPDRHIAIEYNGLYYHTEKMGKGSTYHLDKTIDCFNEGYQLYHIFEDEWVNKKEIVKSKISHILGFDNGEKIGARKCNIKKITSFEKSEFLDKYHIQGNDNSFIYYGSFYNNILVGVMTFNEKRNMTKNLDRQYELSRFCTKNGYIISGLASKIIKQFIIDYNPSSIISFADRRWTPQYDSNLYTKMGFKLVKILKPGYSYYNSKVNKYRRFHKFNFGKNNLKKKYPNIDLTKSEKEIMTELGFDRIWDCGMFKYEIKV